MNLVLRPAALCAMLALAAAFAALPTRADDIQDINKLIRAGQHAQAMDRVNQVLAKKPRDAQARFLKGVILAEQNRPQEAIEVFTKLSQDYPELPEPYNNLAVLYAAQGQYEKARQQLEMSIRTHPSYATAYENLGDVYAKLASQAYDKALQLDSANSTAKNKLSLIKELISRAPSATPAVAAQPPSAVAAAPKAAPRAAEPKSEPAAPRTGPATAQASAPGAGDEVLKTVQAWASAWSKKDVDGYLAFYASDFKPPKGEARAQWEKSRKERISAPKRIQVTIEAPRVTLKGDDNAVVSFRQKYRSDNLQSNNSKTLVLVRAEGKWKIQQERVGG
ncbi:MAG TPA: tetratricopeptide repeat protein [Burkholderiales bacterium]|nr:tetratricopeptide repeat protein [Burkholderiales bacterium]